jgi:putative inorganic carbon (HCO3(-)) transporter
MTTETRRTVLQHAVALDAIVIAVGIGYLIPGSAGVLFAAFLLAVAASAWNGGDEVGLAATAYSVIALALFFPGAIDANTLLAFAGTGAVVSTVARIARRLQKREEPEVVAVAPAVVPAADRAALPFAVGLPLLVVTLYTNVSDLLMYKFPIPSILQPMILLLVVAVWRYRKIVRPMTAIVHPIVIIMTVYSLVVFSTSIWAKDAALVDARLSEVVKSVVIVVVAASLTSSWTSLQRALTALVAAATVLAGMSVIQIATGRFFEIFGGLIEPQTGNIYGELALPRASGPPVSDPNFYARILLIVIPVGVGLALAARRRWLALAYGAATAIIAAGTLATYSRGAMVAVALMTGLLLIAMRVRAKHVGMAAIAGVIVLLLMPQTLRARFLTIESVLPSKNADINQDSAVEKRKILVRAGMLMFDEHPLFGVGAGHYGRYYLPYANRVGSTATDFHDVGGREFAHGFYVELASETGIVGLIALCSAFLAALVATFRANRELLRRGERGRAMIAAGLGVAIAGYMLASLALHESYLRYMALYFGFVIAVARLAWEAEAEPPQPV